MHAANAPCARRRAGCQNATPRLALQRPTHGASATSCVSFDFAFGCCFGIKWHHSVQRRHGGGRVSVNHMCARVPRPVSRRTCPGLCEDHLALLVNKWRCEGGILDITSQLLLSLFDRLLTLVPQLRQFLLLPSVNGTTEGTAVHTRSCAASCVFAPFRAGNSWRASSRLNHCWQCQRCKAVAHRPLAYMSTLCMAL